MTIGFCNCGLMVSVALVANQEETVSPDTDGLRAHRPYALPRPQPQVFVPTTRRATTTSALPSTIISYPIVWNVLGLRGGYLTTT